MDRDHWIAQANIERYEQLLHTELDEEKRQRVVRLLAEERQRKAELESKRR